MNFNVFQAHRSDDRTRWREAWERLPESRRDVYFNPDFLLASEKEGRGIACMALAERDGALWMYPFLKCAIDPPGGPNGKRDLCDVQSAYGYGGPVVNYDGEDSGFLRECWEAYSAWCADTGVVAEFCRYHPLIENHRWAAAETRLHDDRETVTIDLTTYPNAVWKDHFFKSHRNMIRRADRNGYVFQVLNPITPEHLRWFVPMYAQTQDVLGANDETRFDSAYFETIIDGLGDKAWLGIVDKWAETEAAVLVIEGSQFAHCHLLGYADKTPGTGASNILLHGIALEAASRERAMLHLGGGRTGDADDPLFRFKAKLSPLRQMFTIGMRCHDQQQYDDLGIRWEEKNGRRPDDYFLFYRLKRQPMPADSQTLTESS